MGFCPQFPPCDEIVRYPWSNQNTNRRSGLLLGRHISLVLTSWDHDTRLYPWRFRNDIECFLFALWTKNWIFEDATTPFGFSVFVVLTAALCTILCLAQYFTDAGSVDLSGACIFLRLPLCRSIFAALSTLSYSPGVGPSLAPAAVCVSHPLFQSAYCRRPFVSPR